MESLFYILCTTIPSHIIPFTLFWNFPWKSKKAALILVCCNVLCKMTVASYYVVNGMSFRNMELAFAVLGFLIYGCFLRLDIFKLLFTYILIVDYLLIVRGISSFLSVRFFLASSQGWISSLWCILLYAVSLPLLIRFFQRVANQVYHTNAPQLWRTIWLIPGILSILTLAFTNSYLESSAQSAFFLFCRISLMICVFIIYRVLLYTLEIWQKQVILEQQLIFGKRLMEMQVDEQKKHSLLIMENAEQTRQMRHDLRHQLTVILGLSREDNLPLRQYIEELLQSIPVSPTVHCENQAVNAIVSHYAALCEERDIRLDIQIVVPVRSEQISDSELCVVFGNLLENAVEACGRMTEGEKYIRINSRLEHGIFTIAMDNSFSGIVGQEDGLFLSSKREDFGVGLSSIQAVVRKHGGDARFEAEGQVFSSLVYTKI